MEQARPCCIAVLITVHNRRETTLRCLYSLMDQSLDRSRYELTVYLTDDGCNDGTPEAIRSEFPAVRIIQGDGTLFWNRGMIAAWKEAARQDNDYYLWVNDDTLLFKDGIRRLLYTSNLHEENAIIVGSTCASGDSQCVTYGGWQKGQLITDLSSEQPCETFNGNFVLIPHAVFLRLGMNDPFYRHSLGDFDYGLRAKEAGVGVYTTPGICGICDTHDRIPVWMDPEQPLKKRWKHFFSPTGNNPFEYYYYRRKHYGRLPAISSFVSNLVHFLFPRLWRHAPLSQEQGFHA